MVTGSHRLHTYKKCDRRTSALYTRTHKDVTVQARMDLEVGEKAVLVSTSPTVPPRIGTTHRPVTVQSEWDGTGVSEPVMDVVNGRYMEMTLLWCDV